MAPDKVFSHGSYNRGATLRWSILLGWTIAVVLSLTVVLGWSSPSYGFFDGGFVIPGITAPADSTADEDSEDAEEREDGIPAGFEKVAETEVLELFLHRRYGHFIVKDLRSDKIWASAPLSELGGTSRSLWPQHMRSPFILTVTDSRRTDTRTSNFERANAQVTYEDVEGGIAADYDLTAHGISFRIIYRIQGDQFEVRLPEEHIVEAGEDVLVAIELLPFFGATPADAEGEIVAPIGSGVRLEFNDPRVRRITEPIYGTSEYSFQRQSPPRMMLPMFGWRDGDDAFISIIEEGDYDASLNYAPSGHLVNYNRAGFSFVMRRPMLIARSRGSFVTRLEQQMVPGDRAVIFRFLEPGTGDYAGMAAAYRSYLMDLHGLSPQTDLVDPPMDLRIFMGAEYRPTVLTRFAAATTFTQVQEMIDRLIDAGVTRLRITLVGWTNGGYLGRSPKRFPADRRLGGDRGLRELIDYAHERGVEIYLEDNPLRAKSGGKGFSVRSDVLRDSNFLPITGEGWYLLGGPAMLRLFKQEAPKMKSLGVDGLVFREIGRFALPDWNRDAPMSRQEVVSYWQEALREAHDVGRVVVDGGSAYLFGVAHQVLSSPMETQTRFFAEEQIPFHQMVLHGLIPYNAPIANLRSDPNAQFLRQIEFGALPLFELTYEEPVVFKETTYNHLFSSLFDDWIDQLVREYRAINVEMGWLQSLFMTGHRMLSPKVAETTYSDGTRVIVNYGDTPFDAGEITVGAYDYAVVVGEGVAHAQAPDAASS